MKTDTICDVPGIKVGHAQDTAARTGCTVIIPDVPAIAGVDVRGSAPGTREIELLYPTRLVPFINAVLLTGGSAYGLDAAGGVQQFLEEKGIGYNTGDAVVPIVPAAVIYDLGVGDATVRPDKSMGSQAARNAAYDDVSQGSIGAGTGATVGKFAGEKQSMKGGIGSASVHLGNDIIIGALVVVNALGNIIDPETHQTIAGARNPEDGSFLNPMEVMTNFPASFQPAMKNTTLAVIATNATLGKEDVTKIAQMAHDGFARAIHPAHTQFDGDIIFMIATGSAPACSALLAGTAAAEIVATAIARSVRFANELEG